MANDGQSSSARSEWLSRDLPNVDMKTDETGLYLPPRNIKECHPGVGEFYELTEPKFLHQPKAYQAAAQNPWPKPKQKDWFFYPKRVELSARSFTPQRVEIPLMRFPKKNTYLGE